MKPKVWHRNDPACPPDAVYVGRPSKWGNPFKIGEHGTREEVIEKFRQMLLRNDKFWSVKRHELRIELRDRDLSCWCAPLPCHADVLLEIANQWQEKPVTNVVDLRSSGTGAT